MRYRHILLSLSLCCATVVAQQLPMKLWYDKPAVFFEESLPLGNGKLGALVYGNPDNDTVRINDITFWTGKPVDASVGRGANRVVPEIRKALFSGDYRKADSLQHELQGPDCQDYMPLGTLAITDCNKGSATAYYRQLSVDSAIVSDRFVRNGVTFRRDYLASYPDKAIAIRLSASRKGSINVVLSLSSLVCHNVRTSDGNLVMTGHAVGDDRETIHFCTMLGAKTVGGSVKAKGTTVTISNADEAVIYVVNETSFNGYDKHPVNEGAPYLENVKTDLDNVSRLSFEDVLTRHIGDYKPIFDRVKLNFDGAEFNSSETTDAMIRNYGKGTPQDKYLEALYFQYGRFLLIASSRTPCVPANLQGLWNDKLKAPWHGSYTTNINLEENYWLCDVTNMSEMFDPLVGFVRNLSVNGRASAWNYYGVDKGWSCGHNTDIWAMTNPVGEGRDKPRWVNWNLGGAWLMQNLYDHYLYTQDKDYLRNTAYPLMKGAADFVVGWLIPNPNKPSELITVPCTSPEAGYITDKGYNGNTFYGGTSDLALIRELLNNTVEAASVLGIDKCYADSLRRTCARLHPYVVGHNCDLNEWYYDWDDEDPHHRHQSHLVGLHPGHQITVKGTPALAKAAARSLEMRGDRTTGWSTGWRISLWARLHNSVKAYQMYQKLLCYVNPQKTVELLGGTYPNLFDAHPPFQIDGNFGGAAGVCEMLMQSGDGTIELLPALPRQWSSGSISGLKARGGFGVSMTWRDGRVTKATITGRPGTKVTVLYNGKKKVVKFSTSVTSQDII